MKVIFLDIDGVLNDTAYFKWRHLHKPVPKYESSLDFHVSMINPKKCELLNQVIAETDAKIVVSSTWRHDPEIATILTSVGITAEFLGITPCFSAGLKCPETKGLHIPRGLEIEHYISEHYPFDYKERVYNGLEGYVILDDDGDMLYHQRKNFVHTNGFRGLTPRDAAKAIKVLNHPLKL